MFMGERVHYASRKLEAREHPDEVLSFVADGMQQTHCELPYMKNMYSGFPKIKQHLQGITTHGKRTRIYRSYNNITNGANLAIHTWFLAVQEEYAARRAQGKLLQRKIYVQVDGGSENANYTFFAACELLIAMQIGVEEIWVVRMPKGHNHADQDGKFAIIWTHVRDRALLSPAEYEAAIKDALKKHEGGVGVIDLFTVPNYSRLLKGTLYFLTVTCRLLYMYVRYRSSRSHYIKSIQDAVHTAFVSIRASREVRRFSARS
jgi:hypothetical protein